MERIPRRKAKIIKGIIVVKSKQDINKFQE